MTQLTVMPAARHRTGERASQANESRLGGGVVDLERTSHDGGHGSDVDDPAEPRLAHGDDGGLRQVKCSREIDAQRVVPGLVTEIGQLVLVQRPGIVDEVVDSPVPCDHVSDELTTGTGITHVDTVRGDNAGGAVLRHEALGCCVVLMVGGGNDRPLGGQAGEQWRHRAHACHP